MSAINGAAHLHALADEFLMNGVFSLERPIEYGSFSFVPITKMQSPEAEMDYINAAEALETGDLVILEGGDQVETLIAQNKGTQSVLIEASEVLLGDGSQDRIVLQSTILQPGEERRIPVKCVHAPHPLRRGTVYRSVGASGKDLRKSIHLMKYQSIMTDIEHYVPEAAVDQGEVWGEVSGYASGAGAKDPTKYTEALEKKQKEVTKAADQIRNQLPEHTCGLIVIKRESGIQAFELYRSSKAFQKRAGFIESLLMDDIVTDAWPLEGEAAWATAIQLIYRLREVTEKEVIVKEGSSNLHIGVDELVGEAIVAQNLEVPDQSILYCTLSPSS
ncbi:MAG: ARPP-1 family domain-containing protein [Candidatus Thorarchaeota archaeon]